MLVEALALTGRVEEAAAASGHIVSRLGTEAPELRMEVRLRLSQAAVGASRWRWRVTTSAPPSAWPEPPQRLACAPAWASSMPRWPSPPMTSMRPSFHRGHSRHRGQCPGCPLSCAGLIGRSHRLRDLSAARAAFESALVTAEAADLPLWRLRALHELGTIDLLHHAEWSGCPRRGAPPSRRCAKTWRFWICSSPRPSPAARTGHV